MLNQRYMTISFLQCHEVVNKATEAPLRLMVDTSVYGSSVALLGPKDRLDSPSSGVQQNLSEKQ